MSETTGVNRREFLATVAAAQGAFVLGFCVPSRAGAPFDSLALTQGRQTSGGTASADPAVPEINAWIVVAPDDTVTIRIAQTELGQGVWTSNAR
jgi:isoquinoline 1-oxidoreductase beta subunit